MLFNSYEFIFIFLPITLFGYFLISKKSITFSNVWLAAASFFFYGYWDIRFVPILAGSILWNFLSGIIIDRAKNKKLMLFIAIAANIALLCYFKYTDFFIKSINKIAHTDWNLLNIVLPLGISFWTFTQTAYLIDVYRGNTKPCSFVDYVLFVMIFPHLISGPIINHSEMIPQFNESERHKLNLDNFTHGLMFFIFGLFKKVVIADSLAPVVDEYFNSSTLSILGAWIGVFAYTFQLYFDFSGYSEMALGLGKMLNIDFPINFDSPYKSKSPIEFWQRWHMTLGSWIRDYLYIPLGGNRKGQVRKMMNLFIAMTLSGFWHGAGLKYIVWGIWHGLLLVINHTWRFYTKTHNIKLPKTLSGIITFASVTLGWIIFKAGGIRSAFTIMKKLVDISSIQSITISQDQSWILLALLILGVIIFRMPNTIELIKKHFKTNIRWILIAVFLTTTCIYFLNKNSVFLYFDF